MELEPLKKIQLKQGSLGGYSSEVPPLPIPNREVKLTHADGTAYLGGRVGSRLFEEQANDGLLLFFSVIAPHLLHKTISEHRAVPTYYPYAHCFAMHKICGTLPKNQEEQEGVVLRKGATAWLLEEAAIYFLPNRVVLFALVSLTAL